MPTLQMRDPIQRYAHSNPYSEVRQPTLRTSPMLLDTVLLPMTPLLEPSCFYTPKMPVPFEGTLAPIQLDKPNMKQHHKDKEKKE